MCNGCCIKAIRWNNNALEYMIGGEWKPVPGTPPTSLPPNVPPLDPDIPPTQSNACFKAIGVWGVFERMIDAHFIAWDEASPETPLTVYLRMGHVYPEMKMDNYRHMSFWVDWTGEDRSALLIAWNTYKATLKETVLCYFQDIFSKEGILSDADLAAWKSYEFDSGDADLDSFLTDALDNPEDSYYKEQASYAIADATGECDCVGNTPPPDVPEGYGRIDAYFGQAFNNNNFPEGIADPQAFLDALTHSGEFLSATSIASTLQASLDDNQALSVMFAAPAGVVIKKLKFTFAWAFGAVPTKEFDAGAAYSADLTTDFALKGEGHVESEAVVTPDAVEDDFSANNPRFVWKNYAAYGTDIDDTHCMVMSSIRFDLAAADNSWTRNNVNLGELFQL